MGYLPVSVWDTTFFARWVWFLKVFKRVSFFPISSNVLPGFSLDWVPKLYELKFKYAIFYA